MQLTMMVLVAAPLMVKRCFTQCGCMSAVGVASNSLRTVNPLMMQSEAPAPRLMIVPGSFSPGLRSASESAITVPSLSSPTKPFVCDRDGIMRRHLEQIGRERRSGYSWYNYRPAELYPLYEEWAAKYDPRHKVKISLETKGANETGAIEMFRKPVLNPKDYDVVVATSSPRGRPP